jgi:hypothetical protein
VSEIKVRPHVTVTSTPKSLGQRLALATGAYNRAVVAYARGQITTGQLVDAAETMRSLQQQYESNGS